MQGEQTDVIDELARELEPYLGKFDGRNPDQWRIEELAIIVAELHSFLNCEFKGKVPGKILKQVKKERQGMNRDLYSPSFLEQMMNHLDSLELRLYQVLLPVGIYQDITMTLPQYSPDAPSRKKVVQMCLEQCRERFEGLEDKERRLTQPIGSKLMGRQQPQSTAGIKGWHIFGAYVQNIHELFHMMTAVSGRGWNKRRATHDKGRYPLGLRQFILRFFQTNFPKRFDDLSLADIASRLEYEERKVKRKMYSLQERMENSPTLRAMKGEDQLN